MVSRQGGIDATGMPCGRDTQSTVFLPPPSSTSASTFVAPATPATMTAATSSSVSLSTPCLFMMGGSKGPSYVNDAWLFPCLETVSLKKTSEKIKSGNSRVGRSGSLFQSQKNLSAEGSKAGAEATNDKEITANVDAKKGCCCLQ